MLKQNTQVICVTVTVISLSLENNSVKAIPGEGTSTFFSLWIFQLQAHIYHIHEEAHARVHFSAQNSLEKENAYQFTADDANGVTCVRTSTLSLQLLCPGQSGAYAQAGPSAEARRAAEGRTGSLT